MKETVNPIALQSKKWIVASLFDLMEEYKYSEITITDISKYAGLDRRTFYRNFRSKEDVICSYIKEMCNEYISMLRKESTPSTFLTAKTYFMLCLKHLDFISLMNKHELLGFLLTKYNEYMPSLQVRDISPEMVEYYGDDLAYLYAFNNGGFWNLSIQWVQSGAVQTPSEMADVVCKIVRGMSECSTIAFEGPKQTNL